MLDVFHLSTGNRVDRQLDGTQVASRLPPGADAQKWCALRGPVARYGIRPPTRLGAAQLGT